MHIVSVFKWCAITTAKKVNKEEDLGDFVPSRL